MTSHVKETSSPQHVATPKPSSHSNTASTIASIASIRSASHQAENLIATGFLSQDSDDSAGNSIFSQHHGYLSTLAREEGSALRKIQEHRARPPQAPADTPEETVTSLLHKIAVLERDLRATQEDRDYYRSLFFGRL